MQRRQGNALLDGGHHLVVDARGVVEVFAAVDHAMPHRLRFELFDALQDLGDGGGVGAPSLPMRSTMPASSAWLVPVSMS